MGDLTLLNDATSPFGRKCLVAALERSIRIKEEFVDLYKAGKLDDFNPLRQIPVLVTEDSVGIYDSDSILVYLDTRHRGSPLFASGSKRWDVLSRVSLGNGLMEATLQRIMELRRPKHEQSSDFIRKMEERIGRVLQYVETFVDDLDESAGDSLRADQITIAVALAYVDFRFSTEWRGRFIWVASWADGIGRRQSMVVTAPTRTAPLPTAD